MGSASSNQSERRLSKNVAKQMMGAYFDEQRFNDVAVNGKITMSQMKHYLAEKELTADPDITAELQNLDLSTEYVAVPKIHTKASCPFNLPLSIRVAGGSHRATDATAWLLEDIGGGAMILKVIDGFYKKVSQDNHLQQFFMDISDPHAPRLANWIIEKMGGGDVWTFERRSRPRKVVQLADGHEHVVHDRSSAHVAAWYSPKREPHLVGQHFKLDDCRIWLRLHFWSVREQGLFQHPAFVEWYTRFLGHFIRIYERTAVQFVRESARWSANPANLEEYQSNGRSMHGVLGFSYEQAIRQLPFSETVDGNAQWPYDIRGSRTGD
jgi:hypothetical protein